MARRIWKSLRNVESGRSLSILCADNKTEMVYLIAAGELVPTAFLKEVANMFFVLHHVLFAHLCPAAAFSCPARMFVLRCHNESEIVIYQVTTFWRPSTTETQLDCHLQQYVPGQVVVLKNKIFCNSTLILSYQPAALILLYGMKL